VFEVLADFAECLGALRVEAKLPVPLARRYGLVDDEDIEVAQPGCAPSWPRLAEHAQGYSRFSSPWSDSAEVSPRCYRPRSRPQRLMRALSTMTKSSPNFSSISSRHLFAGRRHATRTRLRGGGASFEHDHAGLDVCRAYVVRDEKLTRGI